jgi:hypothetical protein
LLILFIVAGLVVGNMLYNIALNPDSDKSIVGESEHNQITVDDEYLDFADEYLAQGKDFFDNQPRTDEYITSYDDLRLHAYVFENDSSNRRWVIMAHGYSSDASRLSAMAKRFYDMGFSVLMPDARGHGESEGDYIGMGWHDRKDILFWSYALIEKDPDAQIVLYGVSMGGATVMMTAGEELPDNVKCIVEDCGYTSVWDEFAYQLDAIFNLPEFPFMHFSSLVCRVRAGYWIGEADAIEQIKKATVPMMFIHGSEDTFVPSSMLDEAYEAATIEKERLYVEGAGHGAASVIAGEDYWDAVKEFIFKYIH